MEGIRHTTFDGNRNACNVWWNGAKRKANLNWVKNFDNANDWFAFRRYCPGFSLDTSREFYLLKEVLSNF
jgi:hypothetical protein